MAQVDRCWRNGRSCEDQSLSIVVRGESGWTENKLCWAYRFYPDGLVLFAYVGPLTKLFLKHPSGTVTIDAQSVLGTRSKLNEFLFGFSSENQSSLTFRSGLPGVTSSEWRRDGSQISFSHDYFGVEQLSLDGIWNPERFVLHIEATPKRAEGGEQSTRHEGLHFMKLK
jgi:hypothetical protein